MNSEHWTCACGKPQGRNRASHQKICKAFLAQQFNTLTTWKRKGEELAREDEAKRQRLAQESSAIQVHLYLIYIVVFVINDFAFRSTIQR